MSIEQVGPGHVSNSYGSRDTTSKKVYDNSKEYEEVFIPKGTVPLTAIAATGISATNLSIVSRGATTLDIASDTGTDVTVPAATATLAGLMSAADKSKLDGLSASTGTPGTGTADVSAAASSIGSGSAATAALDLSAHTYVTANVPLSVNTVFSAGSKVVGGQHYMRLVSDTVHSPSFSGMTEHGSSQGWDSRSGVVNIVIVWYDGITVWYSITQAANASAVLPTAPAITAAPAVTLAQVGTPVTWTSATASGSPMPTITYDIIIGGTVVAANASSGSYTPTASGGSLVVRATATNASGSVTSSSAAVTVAAATAATAPTVTSPPSVSSATVGTPLTFTAGTFSGSPTPTVTHDVLIGGSVVATGVTSGSYTPTVSGGSLVVRATGTNASGSATSSSTAVTVASAPAVGFLALAPKAGLTETGDATAGYAYTAPSGDSSYQGTAAGIVPKKIPSGSNGYYEITLASVSPSNNGPLLGLRADANLGAFPSCYMTVFCLNGGNYSRSTAGAAAQAMDVTMAYAAGDVVRIGRNATGIYASVSKDGGTTFTQIQSWPNQSGDLYGEIILASGSVTKITGSGLV